MLKSLDLENFRNHKSLLVELGQITAIIGQNGIGKSNILEAVFLLSSCRSFRDEDKRNMVHFEADYARAKSDNLEIFIQKNPTFLMRAKKNGLAKKQSEFIGCIKSVVFSPETILLIQGPPSQRRRFIDIMISQRDREYLRDLVDYEKVRSERNSLLARINEHIANANELTFWNEELVRLGKKIIAKRSEAINFLEALVSGLYGDISGNKEDTLIINYQKSVEEGEFVRHLEAIQGREIAARRSLIGPHRDDLQFFLNGHNMAFYSSRGEVRSAILALKIAELNFLSQESASEKPILLLDDLFSEFDEKRREHLGKIIVEYQTIITTTDETYLSSDLQSKCKIIKLK